MYKTYKTHVNNGIFTISTGDRRISEPSTVSQQIRNLWWPSTSSSVAGSSIDFTNITSEVVTSVMHMSKGSLSRVASICTFYGWQGSSNNNFPRFTIFFQQHGSLKTWGSDVWLLWAAITWLDHCVPWPWKASGHVRFTDSFLEWRDRKQNTGPSDFNLERRSPQHAKMMNTLWNRWITTWHSKQPKQPKQIHQKRSLVYCKHFWYLKRQGR